MSLAGRKRRQSLRLICEINVSAFLSIQAALLAMLMVLPGSSHDLPKRPSVDLAKVGHPALMQAADREDAMVVSVMRTGDVYFLGDKIAPEQLDFKIRKQLALGSERKVYISADARSKIRTGARGARSGAIVGRGAGRVSGRQTRSAVSHTLRSVGKIDPQVSVQRTGAKLGHRQWFELARSPVIFPPDPTRGGTLMRHYRMILAIGVIVTAVAAHGQQARWASADDETAKFMIDAERQWAEAACNHNKIAEKILADDFQGTSPQATRYTKAEEVADSADVSKSSRDCRLLEAKVRFFGERLALVYGSESALRKEKDGVEKPRCLIWTDTWLKRNGKWQIIAAQDTEFECKQ